MEDKTADEIKKDIKLFNECIDRLKEIGNQNLSLFTNNLQQGNLNTIKFLFDKYIKRNKQLEEESKHYKKYAVMMTTEGLIINGVKFAIDDYIPKSKIEEQINWLDNDIKNTKHKLEEGKRPYPNYIGEHRRLRMKTFITKSKEIRDRLKRILEEE